MAVRRRTQTIAGGYSSPEKCLSRIFNRILAAVLLLFCAPVMLVVYAVVRIRDGAPGIYRGIRLGKDKKPFRMYKFRTLVPDAEKLVGGDLLGPKHRLMTPVGKFLRDTRLDELPQLLNIIRGEMDFVGPRPVRPEVYEKQCKAIEDYDRRFCVRPGLIGVSQLFTPHSTPKSLRSMIDNSLLRRKERAWWDVYIVGATVLIVLRAVLVRGTRFVYQQLFLSRLCRRYSEKRQMERIRPEGAWVLALPEEGAQPVEIRAELIDINAEAFLMRCPEITGAFPRRFRLQTVKIRKCRRHSQSIKTALCEGTLYRKLEGSADGCEYVVMYTPVSPLNHYIIHQYFLVESLAWLG